MSGPRLAAKARLKWDKHEGRFMVLYPERGMTLNETAAAIVKKCDGTRSVEAIIGELAREAGHADEAQVRADVLAFLAELRKRGLLDEGPQGAGR